jgi:hypothetical protein
MWDCWGLVGFSPPLWRWNREGFSPCFPADVKWTANGENQRLRTPQGPLVTCSLPTPPSLYPKLTTGQTAASGQRVGSTLWLTRHSVAHSSGRFRNPAWNKRAAKRRLLYSPNKTTNYCVIKRHQSINSELKAKLLFEYALIRMYLIVKRMHLCGFIQLGNSRGVSEIGECCRGRSSALFCDLCEWRLNDSPHRADLYIPADIRHLDSFTCNPHLFGLAGQINYWFIKYENMSELGYWLCLTASFQNLRFTGLSTTQRTAWPSCQDPITFYRIFLGERFFFYLHSLGCVGSWELMFSFEFILFSCESSAFQVEFEMEKKL